MKQFILITLMASTLFNMCDEEDDNTALLAALAVASSSGMSCNTALKSGVGSTAETLSFISNSSSTSSSNTHVTYFSSSNVTTGHELAIGSTSATMTSVEIKAYSGSDCSAITGTDISGTLFTGCTANANQATCGFTANGNYVFEVFYSSAVTDMSATVGIP